MPTVEGARYKRKLRGQAFVRSQIYLAGIAVDKINAATINPFNFKVASEGRWGLFDAYEEAGPSQS